MRLYKPTYSKPLPKRAKVFVCKRGKDEGKMFARGKDAKGRVIQARLTKAGDKILVETAHWHIGFEDNIGIRRNVRGYTNEQATQRLADRIQQLLNCKANNVPLTDEWQKFAEQLPGRIRDELASFGLLNPQQLAAVGKTLSELVVEFEEWMVSKERNPRHIAQTISSVQRMLDGCGFVRFSDISADKLKTYLDEQRDAGRGISKRTYNGYVKTAKFFCQWLAKKLHTVSPLGHIDGLENEETDSRHRRRVLRPDELRLLLDTTAAGPERYRLTGPERGLLYRFAVETGLRANEIRTLTKSAFDFDELTVTVKAAYSKHRREDILPLREDMAAALERYLAGKMPGARAFDVVHGTAKMLRDDLKDAGIAYKDTDGKVFDFHAFRHLFITNLRTAPARTQQALARHQSSAMTDRYTHFALHDKRAALQDLPDLTQKQAATGTDGKILPKSCFEGAKVRSNTESSGKETALSIRKTPLQASGTLGKKTLNL